MPFPALVCDVGGTNARFALQASPDATLGEAVHLKTGDYPGLVEAGEAAIGPSSASGRIRSWFAAPGRSMGVGSS